MISFCLIFGVLFIFLGVLYRVFPPKHFGSWKYGVRYSFARRSIHTWKATHRFIFFPFLFGGVIIVIIGLILLFTKPDIKYYWLILIIYFIFLLIRAITYAYINAKFDKRGNPR
jgi:uncharacterized membrane protein